MSHVVLGVMMRKLVRNGLVVVGWAVTISLIMLYAVWVRTRRSYLMVYGVSALNVVDLLLCFVVSALAGVLLADPKEIFLGYVASLSLSFFSSLMFSYAFVWFNMGWGEFLSNYPFGWEWALTFALTVILRVFFPFIMLLGLLGGFLGGILADYVRTQIFPFLKGLSR